MKRIFLALTFIFAFSVSIMASDFNGKLKSGKATIELNQNDIYVKGNIMIGGETYKLDGKIDQSTAHMVVLDGEKQVANIQLTENANGQYEMKTVNTSSDYSFPKQLSFSKGE
ncbi:hypothetical protein [Salibacter halophilus]|uniref:DUF4369 domain-containing protein n=1 Tax=Salibacter halophilus TaxID=1803916 RepID=A0A6N6ME15_9FLAO|nr:hypothetical protein [Salibacter halophilus]KAB1065955.1 hypothetical protein F3059_00345 [Salibacter halophilus]